MNPIASLFPGVPVDPPALPWASSSQRNRSILRDRPLALLALLLVIAGVYYAVARGPRRSAFNRWTPALFALAENQDIYQRFAFPTPTTMALVLRPFSLLPAPAGMLSWYALKGVLAMVAVSWLLAMLREWNPGVPRWAEWLFVALAAKPILDDQIHGNVNVWVFFWVAAGLVLLRAGKDGAAGAAVALAAASKLTPALLALLFLVQGRTRALAGFVLGMVLWLWLAPGALLGFEHNARLLASWGRLMVAPYLAQGEVDAEHINQSLPALIRRLTTDSVAIEATARRPAVVVNMVELHPTIVRGLIAAALAALLLLVVWACRGRNVDPRSLAFAHAYGLVLIVTLLASERTWKHHYCLAIPSFAALLASGAGPRGGRIALVCLLAASALLFGTSQDLADGLWGEGTSEWILAFGAYTAAAAALLLGHAAVLGRERDRKRRALA